MYKTHSKISTRENNFSRLKINFLAQEIGHDTINSMNSRVAAINKIPPSTDKIALMSFICALNVYTKFVEKLNTNAKPLNELLHGNSLRTWTSDTWT